MDTTAPISLGEAKFPNGEKSGSKCTVCGLDWGEHMGIECPSWKTYRAPSPTNSIDEKTLRLFVVGVGGIGGILTKFLWKMTNSPDTIMELWDFDKFEFRNLERQYFKKIGYKAKVLAKDYQDEPNNLSAIVPVVIRVDSSTSIPRRTTRQNYVFCCVDNHYTRKLVNEDCKNYDNVTLISGGNELTDGNVQFFVKKNGELIMGDYLDTYHPEIKSAKPEKVDKSESCMLSPDPQLLITNANIAIVMLNIFHSLRTEQHLDYSEVYVDVLQNKVLPVFRKKEVKTEIE